MKRILPYLVRVESANGRVGGTAAAALEEFRTLCRPLTADFPKGSPEYEDRIAALAARVAAEDPECRVRRVGRRPCPKGNGEQVLGKLPGGVRWTDIAVCNCRRCGLRLLGESFEVVRRVGLRRGHRAARHLPPPVAARRDGIPYCGRCVEEVRARTHQEGQRTG